MSEEYLKTYAAKFGPKDDPVCVDVRMEPVCLTWEGRIESRGVTTLVSRGSFEATKKAALFHAFQTCETRALEWDRVRDDFETAILDGDAP